MISSPDAPSRAESSTTAQQSFEEGNSSEGSTDGYATPDEYVEDEACDTDDSIRGSLLEADSVKAEGTEYFRTGKWTEALQCYRRALAMLPRRKEAVMAPHDAKGKGKVDARVESPSGVRSEGGGADEVTTAVELSEIERRCAKARSVLNGNIGACHVKLNEHKEAAEACGQALLDDPLYVKALHRRATCNDQLGTWSSLAAAEEDYKRLLELLPSNSPLLSQIRLALQHVAPRREAAQKAEMGEMMDKLKGLGNSILGNFGLSTDNFKFEPNGQGGYSMNFVR
ncbi:TPR-like protein [Hysterangium stoloniferum]|nr:TPR-like protein [Hysterangium stoloniferum]